MAGDAQVQVTSSTLPDLLYAQDHTRRFLMWNRISQFLHLHGSLPSRGVEH